MNECNHKWDAGTCMFCKLESERDAARAEVERLREEAAIEFDRAETAAKEVERLREALRGLTEESCREHCTGGRVHRNECIEARAALAGSPVETRREKAEAWLNQGPEVSGTLAFHTEPVETRRALAERQREACAQYLKHWTYDEHTLSRVRATPLVTEEKP